MVKMQICFFISTMLMRELSLTTALLLELNFGINQRFSPKISSLTQTNASSKDVDVQGDVLSHKDIAVT